MRNIRWEAEGNCFGQAVLEPLEGRRVRREQGKVEEGAQLTSDWRERLDGWKVGWRMKVVGWMGLAGRVGIWGGNWEFGKEVKKGKVDYSMFDV